MLQSWLDWTPLTQGLLQDHNPGSPVTTGTSELFWGGTRFPQGLKCAPFPRFVCRNPNPCTLRWDCIWRKSFQELIKVKEDHKDGVLPVYPRVGALMRRERDTRNTHTHTHTHTHTQRQHEDPARRQLSTSQGERPQENPNLLTPWSWIASLQNCEKINFCCLIH